MSRRRQSPGVTAVMGLFAFLGLLLLLEGAARWVAPALPRWQGDGVGGVVLSGHPTRLWFTMAGVKRNHETTATINQLGLRGQTPKLPRPVGRERILVLGDSSAWGFGVADDRTYSVGLEQALGDRGVDADVINAAVPGYSIAQSTLLMDDVGWGLDPTLVVIGNLWSDNNFDAFRDEDLLRSRRFADLNPFAHSAAVRLLAGLAAPLMPTDQARLITWSPRSAWPEGAARRVPIGRYAALIDELARNAATRGVGTLLLAPCNVEMARGQFEDAWKVYFEAQERLAAHHAIPLVDLLPAMTAAAATGGAESLFIDQMHPSESGHAIIASVLAEALVTAGWPTRRLLAGGAAFDSSALVDSTAETPATGEGTSGGSSVQKNLFGGAEENFGAPR